jgi:phosphatidylserine/phosphatidylglycerophosphate/cardiolipin synthase-like enzyme
VAEARESSQGAGNLVELVLSGPELPGVPMRDTAAVMQMLTAAAQKEILLVGYAVHNGQRIFEGLAARMRQVPALRVTFCLDIARPFGDTSLPSEIVRRFAREFRTKHWPWPELPALYYDPRSVAEGTTERSSLHAKCVVVDSREALVTSANFTEAAQERNIEVGVLIRHAPLAQRITDYFRGLQATGQLTRCALD